MTTLETLKATRELLTDPARWAKGWFAYNAKGIGCLSLSPDACRWCVMGAIAKVSSETYPYAVVRAIETAVGQVGVAEWNDAKTTNHADLLAGLDKAIAAQEVA